MKGYVIAIVDVHDPEAYKQYTALVPGSLEPFGGHFIARGGRHEMLESSLSATRVVIIEFDSYDNAVAWYNSDTYQAIKDKRLVASDGHLIAVEGV